MQSQEIADLLGVSSGSRVRVIVNRARSKGDERAVLRRYEAVKIEPHIRVAIINAAMAKDTTPKAILREAVCSYLGIG
jgi:hypothetical protein